MRRFCLALIAAAALCSAAAAAGYDDPDAPETERAAREALPNAKRIDVEAKVIDVIGIQSQVAGRVQDLEAALKDLRAKVTEQEIRIELPADVLFDFDKANIRPDADEALRKVATVLRGFAKAPVRIEGHTDGKGKEAYNQKLSERRAESVRDWLVKQAAIDAKRLTVKGWGMTKPIVPNTKPDGRDDPEGRQKNRRVEIIVKKA